MAQPIPLEIPPRDPRAELRARLDRAPIEHAEALLAGYEVLQGLHDRGVLELLRGALGSGDKILGMVVEASKKPEAVRGIRNLVILAQTLGSLDPELLKSFAAALPEALENAKRESRAADPPGLWALYKRFRGRDGRRGLAVVNNLLEAWGRNLASDKRSG
jgi:uncharacterized protein YjgD (DUF1641 family)